jgi:hypothetical protein
VERRLSIFGRLGVRTDFLDRIAITFLRAKICGSPDPISDSVILSQTVTELPTTPEAGASVAASLSAEAQRSSRWKRAVLAGGLSLAFSGMGQLYNGQPRNALLLGVSLTFPECCSSTRGFF